MPNGGGTPGITQGIYLETVATGAVTLAAAGGEAPSLSNDGTILSYVGEDSYPSQVYVKNLATGTLTQVSANGVTPGDGESYGPSLSGDGTEVAFLSSADNLVAGVGAGQSNLQVYVATLSGDVVASIAAITVAPSGGSQANGTSQAVGLSGNGSEVAFTSDASNLLAAGDVHTANLGGFNEQVYVHALTANAASGLQAGQVELVTGTSGGTVGDGTSGDVSLSADGRYAVFISAADNLAPGNLKPGAVVPAGTNQVYVKDLLTGTLSLLSQTANGVIGDFGATSASISADGKTVVFSDGSDNLGAGERRRRALPGDTVQWRPGDRAYRGVRGGRDPGQRFQRQPLALRRRHHARVPEHRKQPGRRGAGRQRSRPRLHHVARTGGDNGVTHHPDGHQHR